MRGGLLAMGLMLFPLMSEAHEMLGMGALSCGDLARMQGRGFDDALGHWVWGFLSGLNAAEEAEGRPTRSVRTPNSPAGAAGLAYDLCARQPSEERVTTVMRAYFLSQPTTPLEFQPFTK